MDCHNNGYPQVLKERKIVDSFEDIKGISNSRIEILEQFKRNLSDILTPDVSDRMLLKFLRAKNYNLRKSEEIYRLKLATKAVFGIDKIVDNYEVPEVIELYNFACNLGVAKDGTPIRYIAMGQGDLKGFLMSIDIHDIAKYCMREIEIDLKKCQEQSIKLGKEIDEVTYIFDMDNFTIGQAFFAGVTELGLDFFSLLQDLYPEIWRNILVINAPFYFYSVFNLFRPIFRNTVLKKLHVVSKENSSNLLLKYIDDEVLPAFLGGKRVDSSGDPMCSEFVNFGGIIPEKFYLRNKIPLNPTDPGAQEIVLRPRCCHNISIVVPEANSIITSEFRSEGGSVLAVIFYRKFGPDPENPELPGVDEYLDSSDKKCNVMQCAPFVHLQTHYSPVDDDLCAPWPGIYIVRLINSYNWLTQRKIICRFRVIPPNAS